MPEEILKDATERLREAVLPVVPVCEPTFYDGEAEEYCTFNISRSPEAEGDNEPTLMRHLVQLHYYLPWPTDPRAKIKDLCRAVLEAGFTYPEETDSCDESGQHYVLEFEDVDGDV